MNAQARTLTYFATLLTQDNSGRSAYEADVRTRPTNNGSPRKTWDQLGEIERWSWNRKQENL